MSYWRMQLHPDDGSNAVRYAVESLGRGYIGLDFADPPGELTNVRAEDIPQNQRDYLDFAHRMREGDFVLIVAHHHPFALVEVTGAYNYIREPELELRFWFRHFRRVKPVSYYADWVTNPTTWQQTTMTDTISILNDTNSRSYQLIESWRRRMEAEV